MSEYDDSTGKDLPDIEDLINSGEQEIESFSDYLDRKSHAAVEELSPVTSVVRDPAIPRSANEDAINASLNTATVNGIKEAVSDLVRTSQPINWPTQPEKSHAEGEVPSPIVPVISEESLKEGQNPPETMQQIEVRTHPIVGTYISEQTVVADDDWWSEVFNNAHQLGISEMTPPQILEVIHRNDEAARKLKTQNQGLRAALEHHLSSMNASQRAEILEHDRKYQVRKIKKDEARASKSKSLTSDKSGQVKPRNPLEKSILTFKTSMGMTKDEVVQEVSDRGKMTAEVREFIEKLFEV